jgi:hypothetical protein
MSHPGRTLLGMELNSLNGCRNHRRVETGNVIVVACEVCRRVEWFDQHGEIDPAEGVASLFGSYELVGTLDAVGSPAPEVLVYAPPSKKTRLHLDAFPKHVWVKAAPDLWLTHSGEELMLATNHRILFENLTRGA